MYNSLKAGAGITGVEGELLYRRVLWQAHVATDGKISSFVVVVQACVDVVLQGLVAFGARCRRRLRRLAFQTFFFAACVLLRIFERLLVVLPCFFGVSATLFLVMFFADLAHLVEGKALPPLGGRAPAVFQAVALVLVRFADIILFSVGEIGAKATGGCHAHARGPKAGERSCRHDPKATRPHQRKLKSTRMESKNPTMASRPDLHPRQWRDHINQIHLPRSLAERLEGAGALDEGVVRQVQQDGQLQGARLDDAGFAERLGDVGGQGAPTVKVDPR